MAGRPCSVFEARVSLLESAACFIMNLDGSNEDDLLLRSWRRLHIVCNTLMANLLSDRTPLHAAAFQGRLLYMKNLIAMGWNVDVVSVDGVSPLHEACLGGHYECVKFLLESGADPNKVTSDGAGSLFYACSSGNASCVRLVLQHCSAQHINSHLMSAVHEAAKKNHKKCLQLLLSWGSEVDVELPGVGTPLYSACMSQAADCVELLLHEGADVQLGCGLDSPLHAAVRGGSGSVVNLLLDFGADECRRNADGKTPLDLSEENSPARSALQSRDVFLLSQICRVSIRRSLGRARLDKVSTLPFPQVLKAYILYQ